MAHSVEQSLIIFRHGSVSSKNIFCGWLNLPLDRKGVSQAKSLAKKLRKESIDYAFCSDQVRSKQVLVEVLKFHKKAKVVVDPRLRERHYGALTGHSKNFFKNLSGEKFEKVHRGYNAAVPGGENFHDVGLRVFSFMRELLHFMQENKCSVAISAHTNSLRLIQQYLENLPEIEAEKLEHAPENFKKYLLKFD